MEIYIDNRQNKVKLDKGMYKVIEDALKETLSLEGKSLDCEVSISIVNNDKIRELNKEYRNVDAATDVLSFPLEEDFAVPTPLLGDIIISAEKTLEQSIKYGHSFIRELAYLTVHSTLHLLGYDHMDEESKKAMRTREKKVMSKLNIFKDGGEDQAGYED